MFKFLCTRKAKLIIFWSLLIDNQGSGKAKIVYQAINNQPDVVEFLK